MSPSVGLGGSVNLKPVLDKLSQIEDTQTRYGEQLDLLTKLLVKNVAPQLSSVEQRLDGVEAELKEIKGLLRQVVAATKVGGYAS